MLGLSVSRLLCTHASNRLSRLAKFRLELTTAVS